jgi:hypothetical protein
MNPTIWKLLPGTLRLLLWFAIGWALFGRGAKRRSARVLSDGRIKFSPDLLTLCAWAFAIALLARLAMSVLTHSHREPLQLVAAVGLGLGTLSLLFSLPGTVVITAGGLEQIYWLRKNKRICWKDIVEIETGVKSRIVTTTGADGTKIIHSDQLADRPRFLLELKQNCGNDLPPDFPREPINGNSKLCD